MQLSAKRIALYCAIVGLLAVANYVYYTGLHSVADTEGGSKQFKDTFRSLPIIENYVSKSATVSRDIFHPKLPTPAKQIQKPKQTIAKQKTSRTNKKETLEFPIRLVGILQHGESTIAFLKVGKLAYSAKLGDGVGQNKEFIVTGIDRSHIELTNSSTGQVKQLYLMKK